ncbi:MAG TPA: hypothetical protein VFO95_16230 [Gemmatimonadales bacterium]|nr:hypothetical protein [Gemmatimonadales bacterium]
MPRRTHLVIIIATVTASLALVLKSTGSGLGRPHVLHGQITPADSLAGVFEGRTPCGRIATEFTGFPSANCEKVKWRHTFYRDAATGNPTSYRYEGTRTTRLGRWRMVSERGRIVYHLTPSGPGAALSLLNVDDRVLLLLDSTGRVLVGDASWSYALNRVDR